ncbi:MAG: hypothetical protein IKN38_09110 [Clostridia bacterium]|nr:hypothetical protein [Clostridia bacterium]
MNGAYIPDNDLHIHTYLSPCSADPRQTAYAILDYAKANGFRDICVTDHFWDEKVPGATPFLKGENLDLLKKILPLPKERGIRFMFGCETELHRSGALAIARETFDEFDFVVIPINHFHMGGFTIPDEDFNKPDRVAAHWVERFLHVLGMDLPYHKIGFAHLSCELMATATRDDHIKVVDLIPDDDMKRCFALAASRGAGIELNFETFFDYSDDELDRIMRMYRMAKREGCRFYFGSDAHHPEDFLRSREKFTRVAELLELTERDIFKVP